jgi:putative zinc finger protein
MIPYVGCDAAREMLEAFADDELSVADQVLVESHLRWCRTCGARLEDLRLIGASIRRGSGAGRRSSENARALRSIQDGVLTRIRTEHDQSVGVRVRELFTDMRLLWPAVGATAAVIVCVGVVIAVLQAANQERPESLAAMIGSLSDPGGDHNPLRLDNAMSIPRALDEGILLDNVGDGESVFALSTVVTREGKISNYEVLDSVGDGTGRDDPSRGVLMLELQDAVKQSRFAPSERLGRTVAVNLVWLIAHTTVRAPLQPLDFPIPAAVRRSRPSPTVGPPAEEVVEPVQRRSETTLGSTTA